MKKEIEESILRSSSIIKESVSLSSDIEKAATIIINCLKNGNKILKTLEKKIYDEMESLN